MFKHLIVCLLFACLGAVAMSADEPAVHSAKTFEGTLRSGIFSIGGETTGTQLKTKSGAQIELDFGKNAELAKLAEELNGKTVIATGEFVTRKGVEIKERQVLEVESLKAAK